MSSFYTREELLKLGFKKIGNNVSLSRYAQIYGIKDIEIGNNVRIDDFCILSGKMFISLLMYVCLQGAQAFI